MMDAVREQVRAALSAYANVSTVDDDADLCAFGLNSIDLFEFFAEVESRFGLHFGDGDLDLERVNSVTAITHLVERRIS